MHKLADISDMPHVTAHLIYGKAFYVLACPSCGMRVIVPGRKKSFTVRCPLCHNEFQTAPADPGEPGSDGVWLDPGRPAGAIFSN
jgi:predicted RNA-binding Zn-ribbon protein involved in translation (DUF1610 family)